mmetsp:Transcript_213/g.727  ORF Transcript_213/g.727 Transcript_213/m.727 type:complete len:212 (+) Transcript_213:988-1623(+)
MSQSCTSIAPGMRGPLEGGHTAVTSYASGHTPSMDCSISGGKVRPVARCRCGWRAVKSGWSPRFPWKKRSVLSTAMKASSICCRCAGRRGGDMGLEQRATAGGARAVRGVRSASPLGVATGESGCAGICAGSFDCVRPCASDCMTGVNEADLDALMAGAADRLGAHCAGLSASRSHPPPPCATCDSSAEPLLASARSSIVTRPICVADCGS